MSTRRLAKGTFRSAADAARVDQAFSMEPWTAAIRLFPHFSPAREAGPHLVQAYAPGKLAAGLALAMQWLCGPSWTLYHVDHSEAARCAGHRRSTCLCLPASTARQFPLFALFPAAPSRGKHFGQGPAEALFSFV
jgi:hypothetical protein